MVSAKVHVRFLPSANAEGPFPPRRYTLTYSETAGELFLAIGRDYDRARISGLYTRLARGEVLAEWRVADWPEGPSLHVHVHASGEPTWNHAGWSDEAVRKLMPSFVEALCQADARLYESRPDLNQAAVLVHFHSNRAEHGRIERYGVASDHLTRLPGMPEAVDGAA